MLNITVTVCIIIIVLVIASINSTAQYFIAIPRSQYILCTASWLQPQLAAPSIGGNRLLLCIIAIACSHWTVMITLHDKGIYKYPGGKFPMVIPPLFNTYNII
jgi:hypothetical protein